MDWTSTANLDVDRIMQEVIDLENGKLERQGFLHSTHSTAPTLIPTPEPKREAYVVPL